MIEKILLRDVEDFPAPKEPAFFTPVLAAQIHRLARRLFVEILTARIVGEMRTIIHRDARHLPH